MAEPGGSCSSPFAAAGLPGFEQPAPDVPRSNTPFGCAQRGRPRPRTEGGDGVPMPRAMSAPPGRALQSAPLADARLPAAAAHLVLARLQSTELELQVGAAWLAWLPLGCAVGPACGAAVCRLGDHELAQTPAWARPASLWSTHVAMAQRLAATTPAPPSPLVPAAAA